MYLGRIVERASADELFEGARHPYTRTLCDAVPRIDMDRAVGTAILQGEPPSPLDLPGGCRFHPRCPIAQDRCREEEPISVRVGARTAECFYAFESSEVAGSPTTLSDPENGETS
jgi:oligopeptide/dipeptide ABC transporter ATP-binding protein